ncbi:MAG TPA: D-hexose-6-phosphate mutarotase, partial [Enterobacteriaceae bacterium]|nr:D-hexose-6-phosphate mutarotase [Enterobacteriaceae bacterium]
MIDSIFALPVLEQITPVISLRKMDELDVVVVEHPKVRASLTLQG